MKSFSVVGLILGVFMVSCGNLGEELPEEDDQAEAAAEGVFGGLKQGDFEIITIDECQYLVYTEDFGRTQQGYGFMAHKGNCNNPIHTCSQIKMIENDSIQSAD